MRKESVTLRIIIIVVLIALLLIPLVMVQSLIRERQSYRDEAVNDIYQSWAYNQVIGGPVLTLEKEFQKEKENGEKYSVLHKQYFLPNKLEVNCELVPEIRYRGIYEVVLYSAKVNIKGFFNYTEFSEMTKDREGYLSFSISDLRGIRENINLKWSDLNYEVNPGLKSKDIFKNGFYSSVRLNNVQNKYEFDLQILLKGSEALEFIPLGQMTDVKVNSKWTNPSFIGSFLPSERKINSDGFAAQWNINHFNRDYPQVWGNRNYDVYPSSFGVKLLMPVDEYQKTMRTSKYGIMIIMLTFVTFFMIEVFSKKAIHPIQYSLIGLSLVLFYSILLSISEYIVFQYSYILSAVLIIGLISLYVRSIYSNLKIGLTIGTLLLLFYGFMYVILQLQDYSLLLGNIALFIILAAIMYITRKINWFDILNNKDNTKT